MRRVLAGAIAASIALSSVTAFAQEKLTVWWVKGFYKWDGSHYVPEHWSSLGGG